ncbi:MAG: type I-E CRISPR-associated endonuclease Cas1e [Anaerolineaceae bacterium]|nr:type I-E CRISPR-associated endonuclease Cas1e [Brevefilum sp.]
MTLNLHELPRLRDSLTYHYIEHAIVDRKQNAIEYIQEAGRTLVPVAAISLLMLGPGTSLSHAAMKVLMENGCSLLWVGEDGIRCYGQGLGETRRAYHLLRQAELVCDHAARGKVVRRMYNFRFNEELPESLSLAQIRGKEGVRVRETYAKASRDYSVPWHGRRYDRSNWGDADTINRTLSAANALLNGICHAGIVAGGYSPALGFIHTGRMMSFVYDVADLYKTELTIPAAFATVAESTATTEARVRALCRERFRETRLLQRILSDIDHLLEIPEDVEKSFALDPPSELWTELFSHDRYDP